MSSGWRRAGSSTRTPSECLSSVHTRPLGEAQITDALCFAFRTGTSCGSWASSRRVGTRDDWPWSPRSQRSSDSAFPLLLRCSVCMMCFAVTDLCVSFVSVLSGGDLPSRTASDSRTPGSRWTSRTPDNRTVCQGSPSEGPRGRIERSSAMPNAPFTSKLLSLLDQSSKGPSPNRAVDSCSREKERSASASLENVAQCR